MKKLIFTALMMLTLCVDNSNAQVVREGKVFKSNNSRNTTVRDTLVTAYKWETGGVQYPIIVNKSTGSCYIWKKSKNNKIYKMYMKPEVSQQICNELGIECKSRNKK